MDNQLTSRFCSATNPNVNYNVATSCVYIEDLHWKYMRGKVWMAEKRLDF